MAKTDTPSENKLNLSRHENKTAKELTLPHALIIYESISKQGRHELDRPATSILFSGISAGILISFSLVAKAILTIPWGEQSSTVILTHFGYSLGFIIVILGRLQLFTENTITPILPVLIDLKPAYVVKTMKLWGLVLSSNLVGTLIAASALYYGGILTQEHLAAAVQISNELTHLTFFEALIRSIPAGLLMASIVWLLPTAQFSSIWIIVFFTFLMSAGHFPHIIIGSVEAWIVIFNQAASLSSMLIHFFLPVVLGNIFGATGLFCLLAYAQVSAEKK